MDFAIWQTTVGKSLVTTAASILFAELAGYLLHRLIHSERFPRLSRSHMIHHLHLYGPNQPMRLPKYRGATEDRASLGNIGMEWILPAALILAVCTLLLWSFGVGWRYILLALLTMLAWSILMFSYMHDSMHVENCWMERTPLLKNWFMGARRLHDIHHHALNDEGRMDRNFGIGFFFFDRLFRTMQKRHCPLNSHGYLAAANRFGGDQALEEEFTHFPSGFHV